MYYLWGVQPIGHMATISMPRGRLACIAGGYF
jgi:hypothetical protein